LNKGLRGISSCPQRARSWFRSRTIMATNGPPSNQ
jgi:hypothetical protein